MNLKQKVGLEWVTGWYSLTLLQILLVLKHRFEIVIRNEKFPAFMFIEKRPNESSELAQVTTRSSVSLPAEKTSKEVTNLEDNIIHNLSSSASPC